ncbi:ATP-binding protein [Proteiniphilum saccharofermentans]|uniref:AlbA family DNA-binding domain-containing protein n=1 Tax=Proteiniphilum saccharofermentans TaxID=1642647 RepID=UPI0028A77EF0|nr:ATP-binding protein [Proteiniphilum saccharofermentans]
MYVLGIKADLLTATDIQRLVDNGIKETKSLDYKMNLNLSKDAEKKEFLNDVSSFYNTDGGCLIFGIEEKKDDKGQNTGEPEKIVGIQIDNKDKLFQQIEDLIRSNTDPAIAFIILHVVEVGINKNKVLILGIPKGLGLPSMVTFNDTNRFYKRKNTGKYLVDVYELNDMFMKNQVLKDRALAYRDERIKRILNRESFPSLDVTRFCVIHIMPFHFLMKKELIFQQHITRELELLCYLWVKDQAPHHFTI